MRCCRKSRRGPRALVSTAFRSSRARSHDRGDRVARATRHSPTPRSRRRSYGSPIRPTHCSTRRRSCRPAIASSSTASPDRDPMNAGSLAFLARSHGLGTSEVASRLYVYRDEQVAHRLAATAAGMHSLVLGEAQIQGQIRKALGHALAAGTAGAELRRLFESAVAAGRHVRAQTAIGRGRRASRRHCGVRAPAPGNPQPVHRPTRRHRHHGQSSRPSNCSSTERSSSSSWAGHIPRGAVRRVLRGSGDHL